MFNKIGKKLKTLSTVSMIVGSIFSVLIGYLACDLFMAKKPILGFLLYFSIVILGIFVSWLSALLLYAFGEMVEQSEETTRQLKANHEVLEKITNLLQEKNADSTSSQNGNGK